MPPPPNNNTSNKLESEWNREKSSMKGRSMDAVNKVVTAVHREEVERNDVGVDAKKKNANNEAKQE